MFFRQLLHEEKACASYLIGCPSMGVCAVVDPQGDPDVYVHQVEDNAMVIQAVIETHVHADHLSCARDLSALIGAPLYLGSAARVAFEYSPLADGQVVKIGNRHIRTLHTPGHTPEHVSLVVDDWFVVTGDTLFVGDVGRVDLALDDVPFQVVRARASLLYESLQRLLALSEWTEVYPGHYAGSVCGQGMDGKPVTTIGRERRFNPTFQLSQEAFVSKIAERMLPLPADFHAIKRRNSGWQ